MLIRYRSTQDVISCVKAVLAGNPQRDPREVLAEITKLLAEGRGYAWIGIYLATSNSDTVAAEGTREPEPADPSRETKLKVVQTIKVGTRVLGAIEVESDRRAKESALLEQVGELLGRYLTTNRGKLLLRKTRE